MPSEPLLSADQRAFLESARRAVLATIAPDGQPRLVPICFVVDDAEPTLYTPIDDKPKRDDDPLALARVRDIAADPRVTILVDRWDEDWTRLAWLRAEGRATLLEPDAVTCRARRGRRGASRQIPPVRDPPTRGATPHPHQTRARDRAGSGSPRLNASHLSDRGRAPPPSGAGSGSSSWPGGSRRR